MPSIDKETIKKLTKLCRIGCDESEMEDLAKDLAGILEYVEQLKEVDTENVPPCNHVLSGMQNGFREDSVKAVMPREAFLRNAPDQIGGLIRVPPVMKKK